VLGVAGVIKPVVFKMLPVITTVMLFALFANFLLFFFLNTRPSLAKHEGLTFLIIYLLFLIAITDVQVLLSPFLR